MKSNNIIVAGGGLTGLSAGYMLSQAGRGLTVFESDTEVGGLSKTILRNGFRFDLGGHRFFTKDARIDAFIRELMNGELISVPRRSKIFLRNRYFDYPLKPFNALFGLGILTTAGIIADYALERARRLVKEPAGISLEDWVVSHFGRAMFNIYFKEYSEKVWGLDCRDISVDWVAQRIRGLSLTKAVRNAFFKFGGKDIPSLVDRFSYPELGIGRISDRLKEEIEKRHNDVVTGARVERLRHTGSSIESVDVMIGTDRRTLEAGEFISSIPLTGLVRSLDPAPPDVVLEAAARLRFRDIVVVALMINKERVTDQTWIYLPEKKIPFGRLHEPTNWSEKMAPPGKTLLVMEYFSTKGDALWNESDENLADITTTHLERLGFITKRDVLDSLTVRAPKAYPLFEVGYEKHCAVIVEHLSRFANLHIAGRVGMFRYYNMDHAVESGMLAAAAVINKQKNIPP